MKAVSKILAYISRPAVSDQTNSGLVFQRCGERGSRARMQLLIELIHISRSMTTLSIDRFKAGSFYCTEVFGVEAAVLAGGFLFARAFNLFTNSEPRQVLAVMTDDQPNVYQRNPAVDGSGGQGS